MARVLVWAVVDEPMVRKWDKLQYVVRPRFTPLENPLRNTARGNSVPRAQHRTINEIIWRIPWGQTVPEDWKRYELMVTGRNWLTKYQVMIEPADKENRKWYLKYVTTNWDGSKTDTNKEFTPNYHNRALVSSVFQKYNSKNNKYRPVEWEYFLDKFSEWVDTDEDIKRFNSLYK